MLCYSVEKMGSIEDYKQLTEKMHSEEEETTTDEHKCDFEGCNAVFRRPDRLKRHLNLHTNVRPYKCTHDGCTKSYTNSSHLKRHVQTHSNVVKTYQCTVCSVKISTLTNLKRHYKRAHNPERELYCNTCQIFFRKKNRFEEHMESHKNSSMYKCQTCGKLIQTKSKLMIHERRHTYKRIHKCPVENCSEVFEKWALMLQHKKSHCTDVEYHCSVCNKVFKSQYCYKAHQKIHKTNRPAIPCPYENCNRLYYFKSSLNNHINVKHIGKKFHCDICNCKLSSKQKIEQHIIIKHLSDKKPFKRKSSQPRKDVGIMKKSMLSELTGIRLNVTAERQLMKRNSAALLRDKAVEDYSSFSEEEYASDVSAKGA